MMAPRQLLMLLSLAAGLATLPAPSAWLQHEPGFATAAKAQTSKKNQSKNKKKAAREKRQKPKPPPPAPAPTDAAPATDAATAVPAPPPPPPEEPLPPERVEADVSTRTIAVTSAFRGTDIVVFGAVDYSRQTTPEAGYYDVIVVVEGMTVPLTLRRKAQVAGLWVNTQHAAFDAVPSYYAFASTRPIEEIADPDILRENQIGFENIRYKPSAALLQSKLGSDLAEYQEAITRLKEDEGLYVREDYGLAFIGRSLFRSSIELPANIPVGSLTARVYLFREGALLNRYTTRVNLERKGIELLIYDFAHDYPVFYGILAVATALAWGFAASSIFRRTGN